MGNCSEYETTEKITATEICFGKTKYYTKFQVMSTQPFEAILGSDFSNAKTDLFSMTPSESKVSEWEPLILSAGSLDF
ncbi:hypothetical protein AYI68_g6810 [Smittium mucronatum]|uniref:Uncharacterized protein n=1 Tax=Smittium mucronatum TaxID=133383 RepID=A0A1R0GQG1_9FUNG|nr:hypothetical protein AYI68_g6810 [Smittium mucronatum]